MEAGVTTATKRLRRSGLAGLAALATVGGALVVTAGSAGATSTATVARIGGTDRYDTAAQLAAKAFPTGATNVIIASGAPAHYADALAGNYLAGQLGAPILLTTSTGTMPTSTTTELTALKPTNVYILGDTNAVPAAQETTLKATYTVTRLGGPDRYATAKLIAEQPGVTTAGSINGVKTAIVVNGQNFPDALSAGPLAYAAKLPIIPTTPAALSTTASATLADLGIKQVIIMGDTKSVSAVDETAINTAGASTLFRAAGINRSNTSQLLANWEIANVGFSVTSFTVASGDQSLTGADALAGGPFAGSTSSPILVTNTITDGGSVAAFATANAGTESAVTVLGKAASVADAVVTAITTAVQSTPSSQVYTVTPNTAAVVNVTGTATDSDKQFTVTGLDNAKTYTVSFLPAANVTTSGSTTTFADANSDNQADGLGTGNAKITVVNGAVASSATKDTASPVNGTIGFTVEGTATSGSVVPVVFLDANSNGQLDLTAPAAANANPKTASESFGLGGKLTYVPPAGALGSATGEGVTAVDTTAKYLVASGGTPAGAATYMWDSNDTFQFSGVGITQAQFESMISVGDTVTVVYNPSASGVSTFNLTTDVATAPGTPTAVVKNLDAGASANDVQVTFTPAADAGAGVTYSLLAGAWGAGVDTIIGTADDVAPGSYTAVTGTTQTTNSDGTITITARNIANGGYGFKIQAKNPVSGVTATSATSSATFASETLVPASADTTKPTSSYAALTTSAGLGGTVDAGDVWTISFSEAIKAPTSGAILQVTDGDGTVADIVNGTNATFALNSAAETVNSVSQAANTVLTVTITSAPAAAQTVTAGTAAGLQYPVTVSDSTITDLAGNTWNIAGSGDKQIS